MKAGNDKKKLKKTKITSNPPRVPFSRKAPRQDTEAGKANLRNVAPRFKLFQGAPQIDQFTLAGGAVTHRNTYHLKWTPNNHGRGAFIEDFSAVRRAHPPVQNTRVHVVHTPGQWEDRVEAIKSQQVHNIAPIPPQYLTGGADEAPPQPWVQTWLPTNHVDKCLYNQQQVEAFDPNIDSDLCNIASTIRATNNLDLSNITDMTGGMYQDIEDLNWAPGVDTYDMLNNFQSVTCRLSEYE